MIKMAVQPTTRERGVSSASVKEMHLIGSILAPEPKEEQKLLERFLQAKSLERPGSAPPQLSLPAKVTQTKDGFSVNGETISQDDPRLSPEYYHYYYLQRRGDPRLPPPLLNWSSWHYANSRRGSAAGLPPDTDWLAKSDPTAPASGQQTGSATGTPFNHAGSFPRPAAEQPQSQRGPAQQPFRNLGMGASPMMAVMGYGHLSQQPQPAPAPSTPPQTGSYSLTGALDYGAEQRRPQQQQQQQQGLMGGYQSSPFLSTPGFPSSLKPSSGQYLYSKAPGLPPQQPQVPRQADRSGNAVVAPPPQRRSPRKQRTRSQSAGGRSVRKSGFASSSKWLEQFRLSKGAKYTLRDVVQRGPGVLLELATDQIGSRFIQQKLKSASPDDVNATFEALLPHTLRLCTDVFGNYVVQKIFDFGVPQQVRALAAKLQGHVLMLSLHMYGCRVVQKALDVSDVETQVQLVQELNGHVMDCLRDQNGNHVIQKCIEKVPPYLIHTIVSAFTGQVFSLSTHRYGCRVIQRLLENSSEAQRNSILSEIMASVEELCKNQYGNYVIQHVLELGTDWHKAAIINSLRGRCFVMSKHKFASNVVEKCYANANAEDRDQLIKEVLGKEGSGAKSPIVLMVKDQYANYVVQKILDVANREQQLAILNRIRRHIPALRKIPYCKHILARIEKLGAEPTFEAAASGMGDMAMLRPAGQPMLG